MLDLRLDWAGITGNEPLARGVPAGARHGSTSRRAGRAVCSDPPDADEQPPAAPADGGRPRVDRRWSAGADRHPDHRRREDPAEASGRARARISACSGPPSCASARRGPDHDARRGAGGARDGGDAPQPQRPSRAGDHRLNGSVLLRLVDLSPSDPVAVLEAGQDAATIPIRIEQSGSCAAHALAESKKTYIILIDVGIGDDESLAYVIRFDVPAQGLLERDDQRRCGLAEPTTGPPRHRAPWRRSAGGGTGMRRPRRGRRPRDRVKTRDRPDSTSGVGAERWSANALGCAAGGRWPGARRRSRPAPR